MSRRALLSSEQRARLFGIPVDQAEMAHRMRVNVQLIDAETGNHLWAERFDKPVADLFDRHCHVGQFYLSMAQRAYGSHTAKSMASRVREWHWTPRESAILGQRDNAKSFD